MPVQCATCTPHVCRLGQVDTAPDSCPMHGPFPSFEDLYAPEAARRLAYQAARIEAEGYCRWTRVHEVVELSRRMGYGRIGLAHCPDTRREAKLAGRYLREHALEAVFPPDATDCDPIGQADAFVRQATDFNVIVGMCVGHDALFIRHSRAPVTSLVVRDLRLRHNPVAALYTRTGYFRDALRPGRARRPSKSQPGWDDDRLDALAREVRDGGLRRAEPPCRIEEIMEFARLGGAGHLGLVYCSGFREEARQLQAVLAANGFTVSSACCKTGAVPKEKLGLSDNEKVRPGTPEMICNALAQADLLERDEVELVLLMGQCVGHDSATMARLQAPAVCVVAKDRVLAHNTVAALYALEDEPRRRTGR
jgi:uncharacterized metal-binding protein